MKNSLKTMQTTKAAPGALPYWALLLAVPVWLMTAPAFAQSGDRGGSGPHGGGGGGGGGGHAVASSPSGGGGGSVSSGGGSSSGGSSGGSSGSFGAGHVSTGDRHAATGGSGVAISRAGDRGAYTGSRSGASPRSAAPSSAGTSGASGATSGAAAGRAVPRGSTGGTAVANGATAAGDGSGVPPHARPRNGDEPIVGTAVPRGSVPPAAGGGNVIVTGGGYYPGFYDPWWFGGGYYGYYGAYGGYGGYGYNDPWFGAYPTYDQGPAYRDEGGLRLKIKPSEAEVFVDGYYVGIVDNFNGIFQKLRLESGPHRIEVRAEGYEPLSFDVRITPDQTTTYRGELKKIQ